MLRTITRRRAVCVIAAVALTGLAACSNDKPAGPATTDFNQADVDFATAMSPHHMQAVIMAELAETRAEAAAVKELAAQIKAAQEPEIDQLAQWILDWGGRGGSVPPHGDEHSGPGMLDQVEMEQLRAARGAEFDRLFLEGVIAHHEGAIEMASEELAAGLNPDAKALAQAIITSQQTEIETMRRLLGSG